jgi:hypothetical protein
MGRNEPRFGRKMTHAKVVLKNGKSFADVVVEFATPAEADLRIRNMDPDALVVLDRRMHEIDNDHPVFDPEKNRWLPGVVVTRDRFTVTAGEVESVGEAI